VPAPNPNPDPFFDLAPELLCIVDQRGYFARLNPRWTTTFGYTLEELQSRPLLDFIHPDDRPATSFETPTFEARFTCRDGAHRWLSWSIARSPHDNTAYCVAHDITERKTTQRRLAMRLAVTGALATSGTIPEAARAVLAAICETEGWTAGCLWRLDPRVEELRCVEFWSAQASPEFERICRRTWFPLGAKVPGLVHTTAEPLWIPDLRAEPEYARAFWALKEGLRSSCAFPLLVGPHVVGVLELASKTPRPTDPILRDMMTAVAAELAEFIKRKDTEEALKDAETRLCTVLSHVPIVLFALDPQGRFILGAGRGLDALGLHPTTHIGESIFDVYRDVPEVLEHARRAITGEAFTTRSTLPSGAETLTYETRYTPVFDEEGKLTQIIGVAYDITDRERAEQALLHSKTQLAREGRLASLGVLAAGVAHEINNPLSYILLNIDLVLRDIRARTAESDVTDLESHLLEARSGVDRVRVIVQDLKAFSRAHTERWEPCDVRRILDNSIELAANEIRHRARLVRDYHDVPPVEANPARLGQVFLNLLVNAAQSLPEGRVTANEIRVSTRYEEERVIVTVSDTGAGMTPEVMSHVFEPFFTTQPVGEGTGLGLSICHGIVASLDGEITVESREGNGSAFHVILPARAPISAEPRISVAPSTPPVAPRSRILVADDEPVLANALGRLLEAQHEVVVCKSGREAARILDQDTRFDVILCDLIMPDITGMDLYEQLAQEHPELAERMVFMTGGTFTARARDFLARVTNPALDKPFDLATLEALLRARMS